jgi:hypothetical protein
MPCLITPHNIHVQLVSNAQITSFIRDRTDNRINVYGTAVLMSVMLFRGFRVTIISINIKLKKH